MTRKCFVTVELGHADGRPTTTFELGEFHAVWRKGVRIGGDASCQLRLAEIAPVAAILWAASNHKMLWRAGEPGFEEALARDGGPLTTGGERVDYSLIRIGPHTVRFGERYEGGEPED